MDAHPLLPSSRCRHRAFTLIEILVATVVLVILLGIIFSITGSTGSAIGRASAQVNAFATSRATFDLLTRRLSQSTLNTYYDYFDSSGRTFDDPYYNPASAPGATPTPFIPHHYGRQSNLQFLVQSNSQNVGYGQAVFFVSPQAYSTQPNQLAAQSLLNACAFYVQYGTDAAFSPAYRDRNEPTGVITPTPRFRYRLMQGIEPAESLGIYASVAAHDTHWIDGLKYLSGSGTTSLSPSVAPMADNIIALIVWPRLSENDDPAGLALAPNYVYDSHPYRAPSVANVKQPPTDNQLPPNLNVTLVVISEAAAVRLDTKNSTPPAVIEAALQGRFTDASRLQSDLDGLSSALNSARIDFRIFSSSVPIRESRWSALDQ